MKPFLPSLVIGSIVLFAGCSAPDVPATSSALCEPGPATTCNERVVELYWYAMESYKEIYDQRTKEQGLAMGALQPEYDRWRDECSRVTGDSTKNCRDLAESIRVHALTIDPTLAW
ncbi:hypothetical protein [Glutamicibacter nicotianae]|uniref:hypothetical protein n=1 Tax=Glutamicibacter nicotianae TaxID=37929 RepID=UPI0025544F93|nr:hypothetical protein [Glutamicibacter nicotianae]WIV43057.1 hypothetical protein QQS42_12135 [Glutamicibacter nicotianae]